MSDEGNKENQSYLGEILSDAWEEMSLTEIIFEVIVGAIVPFLALYESFAKKDEIKELIFLEVAAAVVLPVLIFIFRAIFVAPYRVHKKLLKRHNHDIIKKDKEIRRLTKPSLMPFQVSGAAIPAVLSSKANLTEQCLVEKQDIIEFRVEIHNPNKDQPIDGIAVRLLGVAPSLEHISSSEKIKERITQKSSQKNKNPYTTEKVDLSSLSFPLSNISNDTLKGGQKCTARIFTATRWMGEVTLEFNCKWDSIVKNHLTAVGDYIFTVEVSCNGLETKIHRFKLLFSKTKSMEFSEQVMLTYEPLGPIFTIQPINPELVIHSARFGCGDKIHDVTTTIRNHITFGQMTVQVENSLLGFDPKQGAQKVLQVDYSFENKRETVIAVEHDVLKIPSPSH
jgi:hypothetical protein